MKGNRTPAGPPLTGAELLPVGVVIAAVFLAVTPQAVGSHGTKPPELPAVMTALFPWFFLLVAGAALRGVIFGSHTGLGIAGNITLCGCALIGLFFGPPLQPGQSPLSPLVAPPRPSASSPFWVTDKAGNVVGCSHGSGPAVPVGSVSWCPRPLGSETVAPALTPAAVAAPTRPTPQAPVAAATPAATATPTTQCAGGRPRSQAGTCLPKGWVVCADNSWAEKAAQCPTGAAALAAAPAPKVQLERAPAPAKPASYPRPAGPAPKCPNILTPSTGRPQAASWSTHEGIWICGDTPLDEEAPIEQPQPAPWTKPASRIMTTDWAMQRPAAQPTVATPCQSPPSAPGIPAPPAFPSSLC